MKNKLTKTKFLIIIGLIIILAGMVMLGVLGFNKSQDYKNDYEMQIALLGNYGESEDAKKHNTEMQNAVEQYFKDNKINYVGYSTEVLDNGSIMIYKFSDNVFEKINVTELQNKVNSAVNTEGLSSEVKLYNRSVFITTQWGWVILALGITAVLVFVYLAFMEKLSGAITFAIVSILSTIFFVALISIVRVPAEPFVCGMGALAFVLGGALSVVIVNRANELVKNVGNDKISYAEIGVKATKASLVRLSFIFGLLLLTALLFIIIGSDYFKFMGIQLAIVVLSSEFASAFSGTVWSLMKKFKKDRKTSVAEKETSPTEK